MSLLHEIRSTVHKVLKLCHKHCVSVEKIREIAHLPSFDEKMDSESYSLHLIKADWFLSAWSNFCNISDFLDSSSEFLR